jgi:hypothetical protein
VVLLGFGALCFLLGGAATATDPVLTLLDLAHEADMTVTGTREGSMMLRLSDSASGYYTLGGERRHVDSSWWWTPEPLPTEGETIRVCVGPPWPHQVIESSTAAGFLVAAGLVAMVPGALLACSALHDRKIGWLGP